MPSDLHSGSTLDDRHARRSVRTVAWRPPSEPGRKLKDCEKFALKIILRGKNDKHLATIFKEKDIMLALDSPWHTKLVNTCVHWLFEAPARAAPA